MINFAKVRRSAFTAEWVTGSPNMIETWTRSLLLFPHWHTEGCCVGSGLPTESISFAAEGNAHAGDRISRATNPYQRPAPVAPECYYLFLTFGTFIFGIICVHLSSVDCGAGF
jgi:hypothetical protein